MTTPAPSPGQPTPDQADHPDDLAPTVGGNLRRLRVKRGLSLERLARKSGVSRAMLGQIELGRSVPTINVVWKIARALDITFSALLASSGGGGTQVYRAASARRLTSPDGRFSSRALHPAHEPRRVEFYELRVAAGKTEDADRHPPGTRENLIVGQGALEVRIGKEAHQLASGDAMVFEADVPHAYRNLGPIEAVLYLVMTYLDDIG